MDERQNLAANAIAEAQPAAENAASSVNGSSSAHAWEGIGLTLRDLMAKAEMQAIRHALERTGWNRKQAARLLRISYRGLLYKMRNHSITQSTGDAHSPISVKHEL
jgi:DNA-binding NtrC family response regulator